MSRVRASPSRRVHQCLVSSKRLPERSGFRARRASLLLHMNDATGAWFMVPVFYMRSADPLSFPRVFVVPAKAGTHTGDRCDIYRSRPLRRSPEHFLPMPPSMLVQYPRTCFLNARGVLRGASEGCFRREGGNPCVEPRMDSRIRGNDRKGGIWRQNNLPSTFWPAGSTGRCTPG